MQPFAIHAHFAQPQRVNPWSGQLDPEPSAAPDHDWNERLLRTCYAPNAAARIFDAQRRVERIVNNFERLSFDVDRELLQWLERRAPRVYARVLDADWRSRVRTGHGNALASSYDQAVLPLLQPRDRRTQVRWGLADFRHRYGRSPEGFWLPEMAAAPEVLDDLVDEGVRFTLLSPRQARRVREDGGDWEPAEGRVEPGRAYRHRHSGGSGRFLTVLFVDEVLGQALAFDPSTADAHVLLERVEAAQAAGQLVLAAVEGETFGHHHPLANLGLAYALSEAAQGRGLEPTNPGAWLDEHPPTADVEIAGSSAWDCPHELGRWTRDCGCADDPVPGWQQQWREPLREALEMVRETAERAYADRGCELLRDPWAARDAYVDVRAGASTGAMFLERHALPHLSEADKIDLWTLLEAQRYALMLASAPALSAADLTAPATVAGLRFAARVLDLLAAAGMPTPDDDVLEVLAEARSNRTEAGTGADVWRGHVQSAVITPNRVAAHAALRALVGRLDERSEAGGYVVSVVGSRAERRGRVGLSTVRVAVTSQATGRWHDLTAAAVHLGGVDFYAVVAPYPGDAAYAESQQRLWRALPTAPVAQLIKLVAEVTSGEEFGLEALLPEGRQELVDTVFGELEEQFAEQYARLYNDHQRVLEMLTEAGYELPRNLRAAAELTLSGRLEHQVEAASALQGDVAAFGAIRETLALARAQRYQLDLSPVRAALTTATTEAAAGAADTLRAADVQRLARFLALAHELDVDVDLTEAQEHVYEAAVKARAGRLPADDVEHVAALGTLLGLAPAAWGAGEG